MNYLTPDLGHYGYEITGQLGQNPAGGRITYKALKSDTQDLVAIKQFAFYRSNWKAYDAIGNEVRTLSNLTHSQIPKFIESFQTDDGFFLVQEYVDGKPLSEIGQCSLERTLDIARQLLEMLVYLQNQVPIVLHRDIKPDNVILVETEMEMEKKPIVHLVDFGLAKIAGQSTGVSSIVAGTPGFMPPEAILGQALTPASDLYSLGITLICLLTGVKSADVSSLIDPSSFNVSCTAIEPLLSPALMDWFAQLVDRDPKRRFANAEMAIEALDLAVNIRSLDTKRQTNRALTRAKVGLIVGGVAAAAMVVAMGTVAINNFAESIENFFTQPRQTSESPVLRPSPKPIPPKAPSAKPEPMEEVINTTFGIARILFIFVSMLGTARVFQSMRDGESPGSTVAATIPMLLCLIIFLGSEATLRSFLKSNFLQTESRPQQVQSQPVPVFVPPLR